MAHVFPAQGNLMISKEMYSGIYPLPTYPSSRKINAEESRARRDEKMNVWNSQTAKNWRAHDQEAS